jgi:hypothetical protein
VKHRSWLAVLSICFVVALTGAPSALAEDPTLYVRYTMSCTFTIVGDNGAPITVIPPGRYQVLVTSPQGFAEPDLSGATDPNLACGGSLSFRLTGPGVSLHTTLEDGDAASDQLQATFSAGTYTAIEDQRPTVVRVVFTVAGGAAPTGGGSTPAVTPSTTKTPTKDTTSDPAGLAGTLNGSVTTVGKLTLRFKGKPVSSLKAGRYKLTVLDETSKNGFSIQKLGKQGTSVTGTRFLGRNTVLVTLKAGRWFYYSPTKKKVAFTVVA